MSTIAHAPTSNSHRYRAIPGTEAARILDEYAATFRNVMDQIKAFVPGGKPVFNQKWRCVGAVADMPPRGWSYHPTERDVITPDGRTSEGKAVKRALSKFVIPDKASIPKALGLKNADIIAKVDESNGWIFPRYSVCFHDHTPLLIVNSDTVDPRDEYRAPVCPEGFEFFDAPLINGKATVGWEVVTP